jgi:ankyrin repeat protein
MQLSFIIFACYEYYNVSDDAQHVSLLYAVQYDDTDTAKWLLKHDINVNLQSESNIFHSLHTSYFTLSDDSQQSALHLAAENGNVKIVECLLGHTPKPQVDLLGMCNIFILFTCLEFSTLSDKTQQSALHIAAQNGHKEIVECLLKHEAKIDLQSRCNIFHSLHVSQIIHSFR